MKKYEAYKNPGIEWMEEIPEHWDIKPLKNTTDGQSSSFMDGDWIESPVIVEDGIRYLTTGNVGVINYKEQGNGYISEKTFEDLKCSEVYPGDILISRLNLPLSRCCIVPELGKRIVTAVDNVIYRPDAENYDSHYMVYLLNSARYAEYAATLGRGATMKRISRSTLGNVRLCTPPLTEQRAIASYLDHKVGQIDASVSAINTQIEDLKAYRQSVISEAVTKGLNPNSPMKDSGIDWIGEIPKGWDILRLSLLTKKIGSGKTPTGGAEVYTNDGVLFIRSQNVYNDGLRVADVTYIPESINATMLNSKVEFKDVLLNITGGSIGRSCLVQDPTINANVNQHVCIIRSKQERLLPVFLQYQMVSNLIQNQIKACQTGSNREELNFEQIGKFLIVLPPLSEQQAIASYLDAKTAKIDTTIKSLEAQRDDLNALKQSVISEAVTGKIDVREWYKNHTE